MTKTKNKPGIHLFKNNRRIPGAYVWLDGEIKRITNQNVGFDYVVINNQHKVRRRSVRLVRLGDNVKFKYPEQLPARCREWGIMKVTGFLDNDIVFTDKDTSGSNYSHLCYDHSTPDSPLQSYL